MVGVTAFTLYVGFRLELFFSPNPDKMTNLIFYRELLKSLHLSISLQMLERKEKIIKAIKTFTAPVANGTSFKKRRKSKFPQVAWEGPLNFPELLRCRMVVLGNCLHLPGCWHLGMRF